MTQSCVTGKKVYLTEQHAEDALIEANIQYDYSRGGGPIAVYRCDDCGYFHLTSRTPMNERLARYKAEGKLSLNQEANKWIDKFKKR
jgi:ABC-type ATPase with predicted acetyltransferase domain